MQEAKSLGAENAIVDGEIIVPNDAGLSDFGELRKAIMRRQHDLYFVAFDLLLLNAMICATWRSRSVGRSLPA